MASLLQQANLPGGYGAALLQALLSLGGICALAWVLLRWASRRGLGRGGEGGRVQVLERHPLDARRSLFLVKVGERVLLLGAGDHASPTLLAELEARELPPAPAPSRSFAEVLARARGREE